MILALVVLSVIIIFHEFGHFLLARANGIAVMEFSLGFGPRILSYVSRKSGTRYSLKLLPFGGSCAMLGDDGEDEGEEDGGLMRESVKGESFYAKSPLARISVIAAGPVFNFIMAFVFAVVIVSWAGYDPPVIKSITPGMAAEAAGVKEGDVVTRIGNRRVWLTRDVMLYMSVKGDQDVRLTLKRYDEASESYKTCEVRLDRDALVYRNGRYMMGVGFDGGYVPAESLPEYIKYGAAEVRYTVCAVIDSLKMLVKGKVSSEDIAGPVRIVSIIDDTVEQASPYGFMTVFMTLLNLMVMFSANLGVMNLLPFPALDGGRLVFLIWELLTRKPVSQRVEGAVNMTGMALLMTFMLFVVLNDLRYLF